MQIPEITPAELAYFDPGDGRRIAYRQREPKAGRADRPVPARLCVRHGRRQGRGDRRLLRDPRRSAACGSTIPAPVRSGGEFADGTLTRWLDEVLAAIDLLTEGPLIIAGSSMGGWLALHAALRRKERVKALLGIAAAPDFTDWGYTKEETGSAAPRRQAGAAQPLWP